MPRGLELEGKKFGHLTVLGIAGNTIKVGLAGNTIKGRKTWHCLCRCGEKSIVSSNDLMSGNTKSCGCRHGLSPQAFIKSKVKITKDGKWLWQGVLDKDGYGRSHYKGKSCRAHRFSYTVFKGEIPSGMLVCHKNDCPQDVNPDNLFLGTQQGNMDDKVKKGRVAKGELHGNAKLSEKDVKEIRKLLTSGMLNTEIGEMFGVSKHAVLAIVNGKTWKHL